jgi:hypothetical protein
MDVTERSRDMLCYPVCYTFVIGRFQPMSGCPMGYLDVTEWSRAILGCLLRYMDVTEGSGDILTTRFATKVANSKALESSEMSMYPPGSPAWPWTPS